MDYYQWQQIKDHYYFGTRNTGPSHALKGDVVIINILINDLMRIWMYPMHVAEYQNACNAMALRLMLDAARNGTQLLIRSVFCQVNLPMIVDQNCNWLPFVFGGLGHSDAASMQRYYESMYSCTEAPVIMAVNRPMRSFAMADNNRNVMRANDEWSVVFRHVHGAFDANVLTHELLHQFGAVDYYYPDITVNAAWRHFPTSIMFRDGTDIDDLTRYLVGWTEELTPTAVAFLRDTAGVNEFEIMKAKLRGV